MLRDNLHDLEQGDSHLLIVGEIHHGFVYCSMMIFARGSMLAVFSEPLDGGI